jgi:hypothetical protein
LFVASKKIRSSTFPESGFSLAAHAIIAEEATRKSLPELAFGDTQNSGVG